MALTQTVAGAANDWRGRIVEHLQRPSWFAHMKADMDEAAALGLTYEEFRVRRRLLASDVLWRVSNGR